jgi:hypothetical protein
MDITPTASASSCPGSPWAENTAYFEHVVKHYAPEIVAAAGAFGTAPYQYSKLSLRELEAARYRTALVNGCNVCTNMRGGRDFPGMFEMFGGDLDHSVYTHGPAP